MMKLLTFPGPDIHDEGQASQAVASLESNADVEEIFLHINANEISAILFVDQEELSQNYLRQCLWVCESFNVVEVDEAIAKRFAIARVPTFLFFWNGKEIGHLIGTVPEDVVRYWFQLYHVPREFNSRGSK